MLHHVPQRIIGDIDVSKDSSGTVGFVEDDSRYRNTPSLTSRFLRRKFAEFGSAVLGLVRLVVHGLMIVFEDDDCGLRKKVVWDDGGQNSISSGEEIPYK